MLKMIKKFIIALVLFTAIVVVAGCGKTESKVNPSITGSDDVYAEITENSKKYEVTKGKVYAELKASIGVNTLVDLIAKDLLADYISKVEDAAVVEAIDEDIYGEAVVEELTIEEKQEMIDEFLDNVFKNYGINASEVYDAKIKEVYTLKLAKEAYAASKLEEEIKAHNEAYDKWVAEGKDENDEDAVKEPYFLESEYISYYENNNENE